MTMVSGKTVFVSSPAKNESLAKNRMLEQTGLPFQPVSPYTEVARFAS
jgi:hypothetical protein